MENRPFDVKEYLRLEQFPHFLCPGCGHGIAMRSLLWAVHELGIEKDKLVMMGGIGCSGRLPSYIDCNTLHTTHGRPLAFATGLKLARPDLTVIVVTGDGDCLAIGGNHFIHAARRNIDLTCILLNNSTYGMTGGQFAPTTPEKMLSPTSPYGNVEPPFDACRLAEAAGASFVGREITFHPLNLKNLMAEAIRHRGFSLVEVLSDCPEIHGRRNRLGNSSEMLLRQKEAMVPTVYHPTKENPLVGGEFATGILHRTERPEFTAAIRRLAEPFGTPESPVEENGTDNGQPD